MQPVFQSPQYTLRRRTGGLATRIDITGSQETPALFCRQAAAGLRRALRVWQDEGQGDELLCIQAAPGLHRRYEIYAAGRSQPIGRLVRMKTEAALRETWHILDAAGQPAGWLQAAAATLPAHTTYTIQVREQTVARLQLRFNRLGRAGDLVFDMSAAAVESAHPARIDPRLALAAAIVLIA